MNRDDVIRYEELMESVDDCRSKAYAAVEEGSPVAAREWFEAAEQAIKAAKALKPSAEVYG